jgi:hypothetical protein
MAHSTNDLFLAVFGHPLKITELLIREFPGASFWEFLLLQWTDEHLPIVLCCSLLRKWFIASNKLHTQWFKL